MKKVIKAIWSLIASAVVAVLGTFVPFEKPADIEIPKQEVNKLPKYLK